MDNPGVVYPEVSPLPPDPLQKTLEDVLVDVLADSLVCIDEFIRKVIRTSVEMASSTSLASWLIMPIMSVSMAPGLYRSNGLSRCSDNLTSPV